MMVKNGDKYSCGRSDDIVAYIYNEIDPSERRTFEKHLSGCMSCTDEFAVVSDARLSVFEWHKEEFAHLPTPEFSVPYVVPKKDSAGFFASIGEILRSSAWPVTVTASVVICIGLGFAIMTLVGIEMNQVARVETKSEAPPAPEKIGSTPAEPPSQAVQPTRDGSDLIEPEGVKLASVPAKASSRVTNVRKRSSRKAPASKPKPEPLPVIGRAPVLSSYEENEDRSLRLSDLLDEVGG